MKNLPPKTCVAVDENGRCQDVPEVGIECRKHYTRRRRSHSYFQQRPKHITDGVMFTFKLTAELRRRLQQAACERGVSEGTLAREAVAAYLGDEPPNR